LIVPNSGVGAVFIDKGQPTPFMGNKGRVIPVYDGPQNVTADPLEALRVGDLLLYDMGEGVKVRCTYRGDCEGWPLVTFDADKGSDPPQPVRPSRISRRDAKINAVMGEAG
jgi:hypothetical protein